MSAARKLLVLTCVAALSSCGSSLRCWQCGQYSDGVGSITPCTNATGATLVSCGKDHKHCIKYVSELTTVRDCVPTCTEKEWWGARTYCCDTDECNSSSGLAPALLALVLLLLATAALRH